MHDFVKVCLMPIDQPGHGSLRCPKLQALDVLIILNSLDVLMKAITEIQVCHL